MSDYYVYILMNRSGTLYAGVTNDLARRLHEHKSKLANGYSRRYNVTRLVYYETTPSAEAAITREKQIKGWLRKKKLALIDSMNPTWEDLSAEWV
jgi:putative endonuclease